jgi:hypothetical protein
MADKSMTASDEMYSGWLSIISVKAAIRTKMTTTQMAEYRMLIVAVKTLALVKAHPERACQRMRIPAFVVGVSRWAYTVGLNVSG